MPKLPLGIEYILYADLVHQIVRVRYYEFLLLELVLVFSLQFVDFILILFASFSVIVLVIFIVHVHLSEQLFHIHHGGLLDLVEMLKELLLGLLDIQSIAFVIVSLRGIQWSLSLYDFYEIYILPYLF